MQADLVKTTTLQAANGNVVTITTKRTTLGLGDGFSTAFLETGLAGAIVLTILASLSGQVIASAFPLDFCGFRGMRAVLYACLLVEFIGLTHLAWPLAHGIQWLMGTRMQDDERYLRGRPLDHRIASPGAPRFMVGSEDLERGSNAGCTAPVGNRGTSAGSKVIPE